MKESVVKMLLAGISLVLAVFLAVEVLLADRQPPKITLEGKNTLVYTEGESEELLLENMTAYDDRDGDVTDSLRVSSIYVTGENRAIVIYVAKDSANNIGKLRRQIHYQAKPENTEVLVEAGLQWNDLM